MVGQNRQVHQAGIPDEAELKKGYGEGSWNIGEDQLEGLCEQLSSRALNMNDESCNIGGSNV
eukprot:15217236-Heterocapsa_arctica.AAC.1